MSDGGLSDEDYRELFERRNELRRFLRWSEHQAREAGITDAHHQLLIAIRAHPDPLGPTIGDVAAHLVLRHHSAVELVQRAEAAQLVVRSDDPDDRRRVRLALSPAGHDVLARLTALHEEELRVLSGDPSRYLERFAAADDRDAGEVAARAPRAEGHGEARPVAALRVCCVYEYPGSEVGRRILVDRLWPRGIRADDAPFDEWLGAIAPSNELRRLATQGPERFAEFAAAYRAELLERHADLLERLEAVALEGPLTLVTATTELEHSAAAIVAQELAARLGRLLGR